MTFRIQIRDGLQSPPYTYTLKTIINKEALESLINKEHIIVSISEEEKHFAFMWVFDIMDPETGYNKK